MKTIIGTFLFILAVSMWLCEAYAQDEDVVLQKKILTPLQHEPPDNHYIVGSQTWTEAQIEQSKQGWLYSGGVFKMSSPSFTEKNNYIPKHTALCIGINGNNIYVGTREGIYLSTDYGENWLASDADPIDNLAAKQINALSVNGLTIYACTNDGIYKSVNSGASWTQSLAGNNFTCIEFDNNGNIYAGASTNNYGVYKSTDDGENWSLTSMTQRTYCLKFNSGVLYAGSINNYGLRKSTDYGVNWVATGYLNNQVTAIHINGSDIYIGTLNKGCLLSTNGGGTFNTINGANFPKVNATDFYTVNFLQLFSGYLYAATQNGLYKTDIQNISWEGVAIKGYFADNEKLTKMILINNTDFWIVCDENTTEYYFPSAEVVYNFPSPLDPANFPNYNCHALAWHLIEGGVSCTGLGTPFAMNYIPSDGMSDW